MFKHHFIRRSQGLLALIVLVAAVSLSSCKKNDDNTPTPSTIYTLINNGNASTSNQFTFLRRALRITGLSTQLNQSGNYTLYAPTDNAFRAFGFADTSALTTTLAPVISQVLQYHLLPSKVETSGITAGTNVPQTTALSNTSVYTTKAGSATSTSGSSTSISVNGARIVAADVQASNGVIHVIDRVLIPPIGGTIDGTIGTIATLFPSVSFTYLQAAVTRAGVGTALTGTSAPITVFAPTNAAFTAANPAITSVAAVNALPVATLQQILAYHIIPNSRLYTPLITSGASLTTALTSGTITTGTSTTGLTVRGRNNAAASNITIPDVTATNGVVHVIDRLLLP